MQYLWKRAAYPENTQKMAMKQRERARMKRTEAPATPLEEEEEEEVVVGGGVRDEGKKNRRLSVV